jgi:hypothetical protein
VTPAFPFPLHGSSPLLLADCVVVVVVVVVVLNPAAFVRRALAALGVGVASASDAIWTSAISQFPSAAELASTLVRSRWG